MRAGNRSGAGVAAALAAVIAIGGAAPAWADAGHPGDPMSETPLLRNGFGTVDIADVSTTPNGMSGSPAGCGDIEGAAAYRVELTERARLHLTVTELDADGLCAVGLYRERRGEDTLTSLYDRDARAPFTRLEQLCDVTCAFTADLGVNTHYVVVWPKGTGAESKRVSLTGSLRGFVAMSGKLTGLQIGSCRRIDAGRTSTFTFRVTPPPTGADAVVAIKRKYRPTGAVTHLGEAELDEEGRGSFTVKGARGYHDIRAVFDGSDTRVGGALKRCLIVRGATKAKVIPKDYRFFYDDYAVYEHGDRVVLRIPVGPGTLARGKVNLRFERNIGNHRYTPFEVRRGIEVDDGLAIFRMRATYRPDGLPFYRVRAEWPGSNTHRPAKSPWICIQFNR